jgi:voltage-gated potassium channel
VNKKVEWFLIALVVLNVISITLSTVKSLQADYGDFFRFFEISCVFIFVIEYFWRLQYAPKILAYSGKNGRLKYVFSTYALIDLFAIAPYFVAYAMGFNSNTSLLRVMRVLSIFRMAKLLKYQKALHLIGTVIKSKSHELIVCAALISIFIFISACLLYAIEGESQPDVFSSIPASLWWSVISVTTIGYGDIVPHTDLGKIVSGLLAFVGVALIAIPTSIIAGGFIEATTKKDG